MVVGEVASSAYWEYRPRFAITGNTEDWRPFVIAHAEREFRRIWLGQEPESSTAENQNDSIIELDITHELHGQGTGPTIPFPNNRTLIDLFVQEIRLRIELDSPVVSYDHAALLELSEFAVDLYLTEGANATADWLRDSIANWQAHLRQMNDNQERFSVDMNNLSMFEGIGFSTVYFDNQDVANYFRNMASTILVTGCPDGNTVDDALLRSKAYRFNAIDPNRAVYLLRNINHNLANNESIRDLLP